MEIAMIIVKALAAMVGWTAFAVIIAIAALTFSFVYEDSHFGFYQRFS